MVRRDFGWVPPDSYFAPDDAGGKNRRARRWRALKMAAARASSRMISIRRIALVALAVVSSVSPAADIRLTPDQVSRIGRRIWANECGGTVAGLTSWNKGENFASLGIGHFIWYPAGKEGPFEESFPPLVRHLQGRRVPLPGWLPRTADCPWPTREAFARDAGGAMQGDLRKLLSATVREQTEFIILRLQNALPKMLAAAPRGKRDGVRASFDSLLLTPEGSYAMIDYVNFKGEGTNPAERYKGEGWGLLQVLSDMKPGGGASGFGQAAKRVLARRVQNSPKERGEARWLAGWQNRCAGYGGRL